MSAPLALLLAAAAAAAGQDLAAFDSCWIVKDLGSGATLRREGALCAERLPACSTFKLPLALAAFDARLLRDEGSAIAWDGTRHRFEAWNRDHTAASWMRESVVWFSQRLAPQLGARRLARYLRLFRYGSQDLSGGLTSAWLTGPGAATLTISPDEQLSFARRWARRGFPLSQHAYDMVDRITYLETTPGGLRVHGKTGSGALPDGRRIGWFVARLDGRKHDYVAVLALRDKAPAPATAPAGGPEARRLMRTLLEPEGWW